ncbi:ankyrin [Viridothelium virens]|uniref:Ankyrin n=1 Tax=Viridothelium virens TaxID=1048519 RepID=A0A6A6H767_VIRVR|nr:ankyrin [Viridothelium virens]
MSTEKTGNFTDHESESESEYESILNSHCRAADEIERLGLNHSIQTAIRSANLETFIALVEGPHRDVLRIPYMDHRKSLLDKAAQDAGNNDSPAILSYLLEHGMSIKRINTLILITSDASVAIYEVLLRHGWDVNKRIASLRGGLGTTLLSSATENKEIAKWLLEHGADPNIKDGNDETPLDFAAAHSSPDIVELMISFGARVRFSDVFVSATRGNSGIPMMQYLLGNGCDINAHDHKHNPDFSERTFGKRKSRHDKVLTPLQWTIRNSNLDRTQFLLESGADPNAPNYEGETAWQWAAKHTYREPMEMLLQFARDDDPQKHVAKNLAALQKPSWKEMKARKAAERNSADRDSESDW